MKSYKDQFTHPPLTTAEARQMAEHTLSTLDEYARRIKVLTAMLDVAYPLLPSDVQIRLQAMAMEGAPRNDSH